MPALVIFRKFTTRPFGGDDLHIACIILGFYKLIQFICLAPLCVHYYWMRVRSKDIYINGIPPWCRQNDQNDPFLLFLDDLDLKYYNGSISGVDEITSIGRSSFHIIFILLAIIYLAADVAWICMVWSAASLGTPTETKQRDKYLRKLIMYRMWISNIYPLLLLVSAIRKVNLLRKNNYGCGEDEPNKIPDEGVWFGFFGALLVTYAIELLVWPAIAANHIIRVLRSNSFLDRRRAGAHDRMAERFENFVGIALKLLQYATCNRADFRNQGELREFAVHFMELMNYNTKLDVVLSDMYLGLHMLARVQAEEKAAAIQRISNESRFLRRLIKEEQTRLGTAARVEGDDTQDYGTPDEYEDYSKNDPFPDHHHKLGDNRRGAIYVLCAADRGSFEVRKRKVLGSDAADQSLMRDASKFVKYAQVIYTQLKTFVMDEFMLEQEPTDFKRDLEDLIHEDLRLTSIGCEHATLCYTSFANSIVRTPYAILIDDEVKSIVVTVRGTLSLDDVVADFQYNPASLGKTGKICGFDGDDHYCHKGFLTRAKWLYNDIKKSQVLKTLYSDESPFKDYSPVLCGHSLGAGCASILSIMLRPAYPSLRCFAYCPPGAVVDADMAKFCEEFITCFVRHDDLIPRISNRSFETLREKFLEVITRMKVPKAKLFFDVRRSAPDSTLAIRNAKVLRAIDHVAQDTEFYKQLEMFRAERAAKDRNKNANLYIAGKIVHLVDTKGDDSDYRAYVPCWASKYDFNQIIISKRTPGDHSVMVLVDVLRDLRLNDGHRNSVSTAFCNSATIPEPEKDEEDSEIRLFMCFSNPDGRLPIFLSIIGAIALALSLSSMVMCTFFSRKSAVLFNGGKVVDVPFSIGLFSYTLLTCKGGSCEDSDEAIPSDYCVPYPNEDEVMNNWHMQASRVFAFFTILFGGMSFLLLCVSTCFSFRRPGWMIITCMLILTSMLQGLVLLMNQSDLCNTVDDMEWSIQSECRIDTGAFLAITSCCLYFITAIGSMHFVKLKGGIELP